MPCIGLFGTCGHSRWRERFIARFEQDGLPYFNPQVDDWYPGLVDEENRHLAEDDLIVFPVTAETTGQGSLAEIGFSALNALRQNRHRYFIFMIDDDCKDPKASEAQRAESIRSRKLVKSKLIAEAKRNPNVYLVETLDEALDLTLRLWSVIVTLTDIDVPCGAVGLSICAMKIQDLILEGRDAPLFHFTFELLKVLESNKLRSGGNKDESVSLTRNIRSPFASYYGVKKTRDLLVLDQTRLAARYRIKPVYGDSRERLPPLLQQKQEEDPEVDPTGYIPKNEQEERVYATIEPLDRFLLAIVIQDDFLELSDLSMEYVQRVVHDFHLVKVMKVGLYSKQYSIPVIERAAINPNGTWTAEITKQTQRAAVKLAKRHAKDMAGTTAPRSKRKG